MPVIRPGGSGGAPVRKPARREAAAREPLPVGRLIAAVVLGLLLCVSLVRPFRSRTQQARAAEVESAVDAVIGAVHRYQRDTGEQPADARALFAAPAGASGWKGPYMAGTEMPRDAWGTPLRYMRRGSEFRVDSAGPDRVFDTPDDVR